MKLSCRCCKLFTIDFHYFEPKKSEKSKLPSTGDKNNNFISNRQNPCTNNVYFVVYICVLLLAKRQVEMLRGG